MTTLLTAAAVLGPAGIPEGNAALVADGRVLAVGAAETFRRPGVVETGLPGATIVAGAADSHIHPTAWAARAGALDLSEATSLGDVVDLVAAAGGAAVVGFGLDEERLAEGRLPDRALLDVVDRPVVLTRVCGHVAVANTAALRLAGIGPASPDPPGGSLGREEGGMPDGVLRETAVGLVSGALPALAPDPGALLHALSRLLDLGITRIDAVVSSGTPLWCGSGSELDLLLDVAADLPLDVGVLVVTSDPGELAAAAERIRRAHGRLVYRGWKGFADGSLGARTAALTAPYADAPGTRGILRADPDEMVPLLVAANATGGAAAIHAIGDAAVAATLDVIDEARRLGVDSEVRIEHASVLPPPLVTRLGASGIAASIQPAFVIDDGPWIGRRLGPDRARWAYPFRSLLSAGVRLLGGSDAPVTDPDPWAAMAAARDRDSPEALDPADALALYSGGVVTGAAADLVALDGDPLAGRVVGVWKDGRRLR